MTPLSTPPTRPPTPEPPADWTRTAARPFGAAIVLSLCAAAAPAVMSRADDAAPNPPEMRIDLNSATRVELMIIPGIGDALASAILEHRAAHGPFRALEDLDAVRGIGPRTIEDVRPFMTIAIPAPGG